MSYIQIAGTGGGTGGGGIAAAISGNTSGALATITSGTAVFFGGNNVTLSQNGQSITLSGTGPGTFSFWEPEMLAGTQTSQIGQSTLQLWPIYPPGNISATRMNVLLQNTVSTSSNSSFSFALSLSAGIFTLNGGTALSLINASSGNAVYGSQVTSSNSSNFFQGMRVASIPISFNATPGNYWIGFLSASASTNANWISMSNVYSPGIGPGVGHAPMGAVSSNSYGVLIGGGQLSVQTAALPATVALSDLNQSNANKDTAIYVNFQGV